MWTFKSYFYLFAFSDVVLFQPVPTEVSREKTISFNTHHLHLTSRKDTAPTLDNEVRAVNAASIHQHNPYIDPLNISYKTNTDTSVKISKVIKVTVDQPVNKTAVFTNLGENTLASKPTILSDKKIIIIVAYMRTGSTLTASLFQEFPNTFYVFEPVRSVNTKFKDATKNNLTSAQLHYIHGREK